MQLTIGVHGEARRVLSQNMKVPPVALNTVVRKKKLQRWSVT